MSDKWRKAAPGLFRRGNDWRAVLRFRVDGAIRELSQTGTGTLTDARKAKAALQLKACEIQAGSLKLQKAVISTFGEAVDFYLARRDPGRSRCYYERLKRDLGNIRIVDLRDKFEQYVTLLQSAKTPKGRLITPGGINAYIRHAKAALGVCVEKRQLPENPLARFELMPEHPRDVSLSDGGRMRLLNVIEQNAPHLLPIVSFALWVPTRRGELINMRVEDVDLFNNVIRLRSGTTKNGDGRYLPIPESLRGYFQSIPAGCLWAFYRTTGGQRGQPIEYHQLGDFKKAWHKCLELAGLGSLRFHDLRAHAATALMLDGYNTREVMGVAGWKVDMMRVYYRRDNMATAQSMRVGPQIGASVKVECEGAPLKMVQNG